MNVVGNGNTGQGMAVVRVADLVNQALTGHPGRRYESPPQSRDRTLALVEVLLGHADGSVDEKFEWSRPIAGGRRHIALVPLDLDHAAQ